jgi:cyclophilin family peptidyl-prolyl cis-trans isomerase
MVAGVALLCCGVAFGAQHAGRKGGKPVVQLTTSMGVIEVELDPEKAPVTTKNFLTYVKEGHYDGLVFHRVIPDFMIQGGGFDQEMRESPTRHASIRNEADNGLKNDRGTIAMARTNVVDSATAQFFINTANNDFLNHKNRTQQGFGYAVFGRVIRGMDVVDKISAVPTGTHGMYRDVPNTPVVIEKASVNEK